MNGCAQRFHARPLAVWLVTIGLCPILCTPMRSLGSDAEKAAVPSAAEQLVDAARQAELQGDSTKHLSLLQEAVRLAPDYALARWQLGQMQVDGEWIAIEEAQRRAASNPKQADYAALRKEHGESPAGQLALARWCKKNGLDEESRFHWASVLAVAPANEEAQNALGVRWQDGQLMTRDQAAQWKTHLKTLKDAKKQWAPQIAKWRRAVAGKNSEKRTAALNEIRALKTVDVIFPLEEVTLGFDANKKDPDGECRQIAFAFLTALDKMPEQAATESLVRHAVFSPSEGERTTAIEKLKARPQLEFVPALLNGLAMPVESSFRVQTEEDGSVHYWHSLYREGRDADLSYGSSHFTMQHRFYGRNYIFSDDGKISGPLPKLSDAPKIVRVAKRSSERYGLTAARIESQVQKENQYVEALNSRITAALTATTEQEFDTPKKWWDWWSNYNEYYSSDHPVNYAYSFGTENHIHGQMYDFYHYVPPGKSCFAKGTPVWTKTGQRPIDSLELGDLVLSQDVNTGQLVYKPVVGRTVRPPSEILKLSFRGETLRTTRGHPLWVSGVGWRMAKEIEDGAILHGITGSPRVEKVASDGQEEAYNLVVADCNTYFVGESGVLVHDNTPRRPTRTTVPGLAAK